MKEITLELTIEEVQVILNVLGQVPSSAGVYPLLQKVKVQAEEQLKQPQ